MPMHALELRIPPPIVTLIAGALMWLVALLTPSFEFSLSGARVIAGIVALTGVTTAMLGVASFRRAKTTLSPLASAKTTALVTSGIYRRTRNPMYLGLLLALLAWAIFLTNLLAFLLLPAFVLYINRFQIIPEEAALTSLFGEEAALYRSRVRRWL